MKKNIEILGQWYNCISDFERLDIGSAKKLLIDLQNETDLNIKYYKRERLINGTLYVLYNHIKKNYFEYLNSNYYDMDDVISVFNELWIEIIDSGSLLNYNNYSLIFGYKFYDLLSEKLLNMKYNISSNTKYKADLFIEILYEFLQFKNEQYDFNYIEFEKILKENSKFKFIVNKNNLFNNNSHIIYEIFNSIYKSFESKYDCINITKTKLYKLKYILMNNALEYLNINIDKVNVSDFSNKLLQVHSISGILDFIFKENLLNDKQKDILKMRYGIDTCISQQLDKIGYKYGISGEAIRQQEVIILKKLRKSKKLYKMKKNI